jgi:NADPH-dependent glutamate synthase beta subunit-like oxidoreductase
MPAYDEEINDAVEEGVKIITLVSPVGLKSDDGRLTGVEFIENVLGEPDASGRRRPVPVEGSEEVVQLDSLLVSIGEYPDTDPIGDSNIEFDRRGNITIDKETLQTNIPGVFAGGDFITGPNTVIDAIAAGKKAAKMIDRFTRGEELVQPEKSKLPKVYVEPVKNEMPTSEKRIKTESISPDTRKGNFKEVNLTCTPEEAKKETGRCLRCDLKYTKPLEYHKIEKKYRSSS